MASGVTSLALAALLLVSCVSAVVATQYTVGDTSGWTTGTDYTTWASDKKFKVGDKLVFKYTGAAHTVDEVSASDYAACSSSKALSSDSTGSTTVTLKTAGKHYFICGVTGHCSGGMKLAVDVAAASAAPAPAPTAPAPAADTPDTPDAPDTTPATKTPSSPSSSGATPKSPATTDVAPRTKESSSSGATGLRAAAWAGLSLAGLVAML